MLFKNLASKNLSVQYTLNEVSIKVTPDPELKIQILLLLLVMVVHVVKNLPASAGDIRD